jgi:predicted GNAT family N-acyltransferase
MANRPITLREVLFASPEYDEMLELRNETLRKPLGLAFSAEELAAEPNQIHLAAFQDGRVVGCLLLAPQSPTTVKMRQVVTAPELRGSGVGRLLVAHSETLARARDFEWIELSARESALSFYLALGYEIVGEPYTEVTIPHRRMRKAIPT